MRVTCWSDSLAPDPITAAFMVSVLRELGYRAAVHYASFAPAVQATSATRAARSRPPTRSGTPTTPRRRISSTCSSVCSAFRLDDPTATRNGAFYCNPAADRLMNRADRQQATDPAQAGATWAAVDRTVTSDAPWVTLANLNNVDFLSTRVTNYQYNPFLGVLLDQLRIRPAPSPR